MWIDIFSFAMERGQHHYWVKIKEKSGYNAVITLNCYFCTMVCLCLREGAREGAEKKERDKHRERGNVCVCICTRV